MTRNLRELVSNAHANHKKEAQDLARILFNAISIEDRIVSTIANNGSLIDIDLLFDIGFTVQDYKPNKKTHPDFWRSYLRPADEPMFGHENWRDVISYVVEIIQDGGLDASIITRWPDNWKDGVTGSPRLIAINKDDDLKKAEIFRMIDNSYTDDYGDYNEEITYFEITSDLKGADWPERGYWNGRHVPLYAERNQRFHVIYGIRINLSPQDSEEEVGESSLS